MQIYTNLVTTIFPPPKKIHLSPLFCLLCMHFFEKKNTESVFCLPPKKRGTLVTPGAFPPAVVDLQTSVGTDTWAPLIGRTSFSQLPLRYVKPPHLEGIFGFFYLEKWCIMYFQGLNKNMIDVENAINIIYYIGILGDTKKHDSTSKCINMIISCGPEDCNNFKDSKNV